MSGRDDEQGGYPLGQPFRRHHESDPLEASDETPVDLAAVQADDALLNMLGSADLSRGDADADLSRILVAWRRDVDAEVIGELVDTDTAIATIKAARKPAPRRHPVLAPFAAAAAVLVIAFSGVGLAAKSAEPGDRLFSLTKVLYSDYARSVETAQKVRNELDQLERAIDEGKASPAEAQESLERVEAQLVVVDEEQGRDELAADTEKLEQKVAAMADSTTPPSPPSDPDPEASKEEVPVVPPPADTTSEQPTTTTTTPPPEPSPTPSTTSSTPPPTSVSPTSETSTSATPQISSPPAAATGSVSSPAAPTSSGTSAGA